MLPVGDGVRRRVLVLVVVPDELKLGLHDIVLPLLHGLGQAVAQKYSISRASLMRLPLVPLVSYSWISAAPA